MFVWCTNVRSKLAEFITLYEPVFKNEPESLFAAVSKVVRVLQRVLKEYNISNIIKHPKPFKVAMKMFCVCLKGGDCIHFRLKMRLFIRVLLQVIL